MRRYKAYDKKTERIRNVLFKVCPKCGFDKNKKEYNYCIECGTKLNSKNSKK